MRILVVEDEDKVATFVKRGLERLDYLVDVRTTAEAALTRLREEAYDTLVLDLMLPGLDGLDLLRTLRREQIEVPVLVLSARGELDDRVAGLEAGCDDYLAKPFAFEELVARIRALQRRSSGVRPTALTYADLTLDPHSRTAIRGGFKAELTNKEYALLEYLLRRPEQVLTRGELLEALWGYDFETPSNVLEVYVNFLRKKIDARADRKLLHTVRGVGYVLRDEG